MREGLISYDGLPISSGGGHGLGRLSPEKAWLATSTFLSVCTTGVQVRRATLAINSVEGSDPASTEQLCESAVAAIGIHPSPHERQNYGGVPGSSSTWRLSSETLPAAVAWRESLGALPSNWLGGPAVLRVDFAC